MVDEDRVLRLLWGIADDTAVLRQEAGASEERRLDPIWLRGVKYIFVTAIEACVDGAQHIPLSEADQTALRPALLHDLGAMPLESGALISRSLWVIFIGEWGVWP